MKKVDIFWKEATMEKTVENIRLFCNNKKMDIVEKDDLKMAKDNMIEVYSIYGYDVEFIIKKK